MLIKYYITISILESTLIHTIPMEKNLEERGTSVEIFEKNLRCRNFSESRPLVLAIGHPKHDPGIRREAFEPMW